MSEFRQDLTTGCWIIYSYGMNKKPGDYPSTRLERSGNRYEPDCPFCRGNEKVAGKEILCICDSAGEWEMRCVPNKLPILRIEGGIEQTSDGVFSRMNGIGAHEVVIETPFHNEMLGDLPVNRLKNLFVIYKNRIKDLTLDKRFRYILIFKNHGALAEQLIPHSHSQIVALPFVPSRVCLELQNCKTQFETRNVKLFCTLVKQEMEQGVRVIDENELYVVICPYASRSPFEIWILPKHHNFRFEEEDDRSLELLAFVYRRALKRLNRALDEPAFNMVLHNAPINLSAEEKIDFGCFHWHIEIIPKVTHLSGFEWGSGCYINPTLPEEAAAFLREVKISD